MSKAKPLITVGITCFNAENTINRAVESALSQDYPRVEILVVDDCSTDLSFRTLEESFSKNSGVKLIKHSKNKGVAAARNTIIENASGEFIAFFDDDDVSLSERLSVQYEKIVSYEKAVGVKLLACWGSGYKQYENGYKAPFCAIGSEPKVPIGKDIIQYQLYMGRNPNVFFGSGTPSCSMMVRKSVFDEVGAYDADMRRVEDTDFALRLAKKGGHFIGCSEQLVIQSASFSEDKNPEVGYETEIRIIEKYKEDFDHPRRYGYALMWAKLRYNHFGQQRMKSVITLLSLFLKYPLWTWKHFWRSVPKRMIHEQKMKRSRI